MAFEATVSFVQGKGQIQHNNREYITNNIDAERLQDNIYYKRESVEEAYEKCFGEAIEAYNEKQTRNDRKKSVSGYMDEIRKNQHNRNGEKLFYENVVMVGDMETTGYANAPERAKIAEEVLKEYMQNFEKRNPNVYVFNACLHADEATPHLHIDYIPLAHGYKQGLQVRNSLSKALGEQMHDHKPSTREDNTTMRWQAREREVLKEICRNHEIEVVRGVEHEDMNIREYRAMKEYEVRDLERRTKEIPREIDTYPTLLNKNVVKVNKEQLQELQRRSTLKKEYTRETENLRNEAQTRLNAAKNVYQDRVNRATEKAQEIVNQAEIKRDDILDSAKEAEREANEKLRLAKSQLAEAEEYRQHNLNLVENGEKMAEKIAELTQENTQLKAQIRAVTQEKEIIGIEVRKEIENQFKERLELVNDTLKMARADRGRLQEKVDELTQKMSDLQERFDGICQCFTNAIKAVNMLRFDKKYGYSMHFNEKQKTLLQAINRYTQGWLRQEGQTHLADEVQNKIAISRGIDNCINEIKRERERELSPGGGNRG